MKRSISILILVLLLMNASAQQVFVSSAKVIFEKKVNLQRKMADNKWLSDDAKENIKKYAVTNWEYSFNETTSIYKPQKSDARMDENAFFFSNAASAEMFTNLEKNTRVIKKPFLDEDYILKDTIPHIDWKIMHEVRKIAGYDCRKAVGVINDTVYVIAFYTDEIIFKGGPEGFTGLPGLILGLAIPRYNTTWFATKIEAINVPILDIAQPTKGKRTDTEKDFKKLLELYTRYDDKKKPQKEEDLKKLIYSLTL